MIIRDELHSNSLPVSSDTYLRVFGWYELTCHAYRRYDQVAVKVREPLLITNVALYDLVPQKIILHTRNRQEIDNGQYPYLSSAENYTHHNLERKYGTRADFNFRSEAPTGMYNCHGLVFASRRTCIHDAAEIRKILVCDNYKEIPKEHVKPGDILLYFTEAGDDIWHSAIVLKEPTRDNNFVPIVLSKIGRWKEAIHPANALSEYPFTNAKYYRIHD